MAAALALCAAAGAAQAGDLPDDDGYRSGYNAHAYRRQSLSRYCYTHPYDEKCDPDARHDKPRDRVYARGRVCEAAVRAAGKRNLFPAFARNSAVFAWQRETRSVHGGEYASWTLARRPSVVCDPVGGLTSCIATATPCRS